MAAVWLQYMVAFFVGSHGLVYLIFGALSISGPGFPQVFRTWRGSSAMLGGAVGSASLRTLAEYLWIIAGIGIIAAAIAIGLASLFPGFWQPIAIVGSVVGIASFAVFWDGQTAQFANQGGIGMIISLGIISGAVLFPAAFG
jgi:hypothetical protein